MKFLLKCSMKEKKNAIVYYLIVYGVTTSICHIWTHIQHRVGSDLFLSSRFGLPAFDVCSTAGIYDLKSSEIFKLSIKYQPFM